MKAKLSIVIMMKVKRIFVVRAMEAEPSIVMIMEVQATFILRAMKITVQLFHVFVTRMSAYNTPLRR